MKTIVFLLALALNMQAFAQAALPSHAKHLPAKSRHGTSHPVQVGGAWQRLDANGDGYISEAEAAQSPRLAERFRTVDINSDGFISPSEYSLYQRQRLRAAKNKVSKAARALEAKNQ